MRRSAAVLATWLLAAGLVLGIGVAVPEPVQACSCVAPQPLQAYATGENAIFAGRVIAHEPDGVDVGVERWFSGLGAAPVVRIAGDFGNGASCGVGSRPAIGSQWIWVAWRGSVDGGPLPELGSGGLQISICQPTGNLATPEGQALLAEAVATFGSGAAPGPEATPDATPAAGADGVVLAAGVGVVAVGVLILVGAAVAARGRRRPA